MNLLLIILISLCLYYLTYFDNHSHSKLNYAIILITLIICMCIATNKLSIEGMTSGEAIQNVASIFNTEEMVVKNLTVTGNLSVGGKTATKSQSIDGDVNVTGKTTLIGPLTSNDTITAKAANVSDTLNVTGKSTLSGACSTGNLLVNDTATIKGQTIIGTPSSTDLVISSYPSGLLKVYHSSDGKLAGTLTSTLFSGTSGRWL